MDVDAEREKIRREIEELERSLGANVPSIDVLDGSFESASEDEDVFEDHDGDADPRTQVNIEVDPGGEETWEEEEESEEDADINLPETPETCLQMNLVYQEVIQEKIEEISLLLAQNKEEQEKLTQELASAKGPKAEEGNVLPANMFLGHFLKPYFKDKTSGLGPPANSDTREKALQGIKSFEELVTVKWKNQEKELLRQAVMSDRLHRLLQPKLLKLEYLNEKLGKCKDDMGKQIVEKQIQETSREINDINLLPEEILLGNRLDEHDWDKIANINFEGGRSAKELRKYWQNYEHPHINKEEWSEREVKMLKEVAERHSRQNWEAIAQELGTGRTAFQCLQMFQAHNKDFKKSEWTPEEDQALLRFVQEMRVGKHIPYRKIAYYMEGRDSAQLIYRWTKRLDPNLKRGAWTPEEDALLLKAVAKYGARDWYKIRAEVPGRSDNQCRDRYMHALHGDIKKGKWSEEEERKLIDLTEKYGMGHWAKIASELPHRSGSQCLSKWKVLLGYRKKAHRAALRLKRKQSSSASSCEDSDLEMELAEDDAEEKRPRRPKPEAPYCYKIPSIDLWVPTQRKLPESKSEQLRPVTFFSRGFSRDRSLSKVRKAAADEERRRAAEDLFALNSGIPQAAHLPTGEETGEEGGKNLGRTKDSWKVSLAYVKRLLRRNGYELQRKNRESLRKKRFAFASQTAPAGSRPLESNRASEMRRRKDRLWNATLNRRLMMAVTPWAGSRVHALALRVKEKTARKSKAEFIFRQLQSAHLTSTPIFTLFIQLLHIDTDGCMKVIHRRKSQQTELPGAAAGKPTGRAAQVSSAEGVKAHSSLQGTLPPPAKRLLPSPANSWRPRSPPRPAPKPKTVSELLREKRLREAKARKEERKSLVLASHLLLPPSVILQPPAVPLAQLVSSSQASPSSAPAKVSPLVVSSPGAALPPPALSSEGPLGSLRKAAVAAATAANVPENRSQRSVLGKRSRSSQQECATGTSRSTSSSPDQAPTLLQTSPADSPAPRDAAGLKGMPAPLPLPQEPQSSQQPPVNAAPPTATTALGPSWLPKQVLPITWVLTPQGLVPVLSLPAQGNLPGGSPGAPLLGSQGPDASLLKAPTVTVAPVVPGLNQPQVVTQPEGPLSGSVMDSVIPPANAGESQRCLLPAGPPSLSSLSSSENVPTGNPTSAPPIAAGPNHTVESAPQVPSSGGAEAPSAPETQSLHGAPQKERVAPDYSLISLEDMAAVMEWLKTPPDAEASMSSGPLPYLPPFLCSLKTLSALLLNKEALERSAATLVPQERPPAAPEQPKANVLRMMVQQKLRDNPAYQLLRSRFLAAFTFPAALAALPPPRVKTTVLDSEQKERSQEEDVGSLSEEEGDSDGGCWAADGAGEGQEEPGAESANDLDGVSGAGIRRSMRLAGRGRSRLAEPTSKDPAPLH